MVVNGDNFDSIQIPKMFYTKAGDEGMVSDQEVSQQRSSKITSVTGGVDVLVLVASSLLVFFFI